MIDSEHDYSRRAYLRCLRDVHGRALKRGDLPPELQPFDAFRPVVERWIGFPPDLSFTLAVCDTTATSLSTMRPEYFAWWSNSRGWLCGRAWRDGSRCSVIVGSAQELAAHRRRFHDGDDYA